MLHPYGGVALRIPRALHSWDVTPQRAVIIQHKLAGRVRSVGRVRNLRLVAGADLAFSGADTIAGVVVWDVHAGEVAEQHVIRRPVSFPYVPGLLSFREAPAILAVLRKLRCKPVVGHARTRAARKGTRETPS